MFRCVPNSCLCPDMRVITVTEGMKAHYMYDMAMKTESGSL